jgi:hypothetical protein
VVIVAGIYSFNDGQEAIESQFGSELQEVREAIAAVDNQAVMDKPGLLNKAFRKEFEARQWQRCRVRCEYSAEHYTSGYTPTTPSASAFREMGFVKNRVGAGVLLNKCARDVNNLVYDVCAQMTIFHNLDVVDAGVAIVPVKALADQMPTGVPYFEQFVWDLEHRGVADIDIPVLILGIDA